MSSVVDSDFFDFDVFQVGLDDLGGLAAEHQLAVVEPDGFVAHLFDAAQAMALHR